MAASRGRGLRPGGVVRALARLVVLVVFGFAVGLAFGLVLEEPELLARYLAGEGESVELATDAEPAGDRSAIGGDASEAYASAAAEARPLVTAEERAAGRVLPGVAAPADAERRNGANAEGLAAPNGSASRTAPSAAAPARTAPAKAAPAPAQRRPATATGAAAERRWAIQVGAFADEAAAKRLAGGLRGRYPVAVLPASERGGRWRVRIQPIAGEEEARRVAGRLKQDERLPTWVTPMETGAGS